MSELARLRLARASRNWFSGSELACSADAYVRRLNEQGYASNTINIYLESVAHFAHWSARRHIGLAGINEAAVQRFLKHLPLCRCAHRCQRTRPSGRAALGLLLNLLRSEGRTAEKTSPYPAAIAEECPCGYTDHRECRRLSASRSPEPFQGLHGWHGSRRVDSSAAFRLLSRPPDRSSPSLTSFIA